jgi:hypothetical protein
MLPALTLWEMKARNLRPLPLVLLLVDEEPQLRSSKLASRRNDTRTRALFKPGTPRACRIIT